VGLRQDRDAKGLFKTSHGGSRFSTSVGGSVTGIHGHILIVDDPVNPRQAEATSAVELGAANTWLDRTLSTRKIDKAVTPTILIMQRLHLKDPTQVTLDKSKVAGGKQVRHICLPGEIADYVEPPELKDRYVEGLLDPVRLPRSVLRELEVDLGAYGYAGQIMQTPIPKDGTMFKPDKMEILIAAPTITQTVRYWDKAGTAGGGAYTAGVKMGRTTAGLYIILDVVRGQWSADRREATIKQCAEMDGRNCTVWVEQEPGSGGKESAERTIANLPGFIAKAERVTGSKETRAEPLAAQINIGMVAMLRADWNRELIEELRNFPVGRYKDQVDAAAGAFAKLVSHKRSGGW
jgi:predicted phage terminase large subunit-like protein